MKTIVLLMATILLTAFNSSCLSPVRNKYVTNIEVYKVAYDYIEEDELSEKHPVGKNLYIRFIKLTNTGAAIGLTAYQNEDGTKNGELIMEAKEGEIFTLPDGGPSNIKLIEINKNNNTIIISYPFGETRSIIEVTYSDESVRKIPIK